MSALGCACLLGRDIGVNIVRCARVSACTPAAVALASALGARRRHALATHPPDRRPRARAVRAFRAAAARRRGRRVGGDARRRARDRQDAAGGDARAALRRSRRAGGLGRAAGTAAARPPTGPGSRCCAGCWATPGPTGWRRWRRTPAHVARLVPELAGRLPRRTRPSLPPRRSRRRGRPLPAVRRDRRDLARSRRSAPMLLVLDDLHWADLRRWRCWTSSSRDLDARLMVIGTYRDSRCARASRSPPGSAAVVRDDRRMTLAGLDADALAGLVEARVPARRPGLLGPRAAPGHRGQPVLRHRADSACWRPRACSPSARRRACRCPTACATRSAGGSEPLEAGRCWRRSPWPR